eukprot:gb/GFBE01047175.1/.p1 GENE.gb/GFBE01047175.1/~~gb/GFBE01047175.1/.p1  ORF type:complete len:367 (+),score=75.49 gb/GFBE01047175.1/:1-1101(+)
MGVTVERVSAADLSPDEFVLKYVAENTPVILQGALAESWATSLHWTPGTFADIAPPDTTVRVAPLMADGRDKWVESAALWPGSDKAESLAGVIHDDLVLAVAAARIDVPVSDFVASLRGEGTLPSLYADGASNLQHSFGFLESELPGFPRLGESLLFKRKDLWLGSKTLSTLHFDNYENLFAQLVGEKEFVLCPPGDTRYLVDGRLRKAYATWQASAGEGSKGVFERTAEGLSEETALNYAVYDIDSPPEEYAERAAKLRRTVVRVRAGEVLYLPFGWWHQVRAIPAEHGLCASAASFFEPFFVRLQPKSFSTMGPLLPNPKYRKLCSRLGLDSDDDDDDDNAAADQKPGKGAGSGKGAASGGYNR